MMRGVVVLVSYGVAHIYTNQNPIELLLDTRTLESKVSVGQWIDCSASKNYVDKFHRIEPALKTEIVNDVVQIETRIQVNDSLVFDSDHFGKVAFLTKKPFEMKAGQYYRCKVSRDIVSYGDVYANLSVKWHILPNTLHALGPGVKLPLLMNKLSLNPLNVKNEFVVDLTKNRSVSLQATRDPFSTLTGVVVGKRGSLYIIYTRAGFVTMIGRWKRENVEAPEVGQWIEFKSKQIEPNKYVVDSNSFHQVAPLYITTVEDKQVNLIVPAYVSDNKIYTEFVRDTKGKEFTGGRLREAKVLVWADEKSRYRWKLAGKQRILPPRQTPDLPPKEPKALLEIDFSKDVDVSWHAASKDSKVSK